MIHITQPFRNCPTYDKGPSIKFVTLFLANFDPLPLSHFVTHPGIPRKYVTHLGPPPPIFSRPSKNIPDKSPLYKFSLNCSRGFLPGVLSEGLLSGRFSPGWFLSIPPSVRIHLLQQKVNITLNFMFHMYDKKMYKCDVTCSLPPFPCHKLSHLLGPPPLERDVLYGRPQRAT